MADHLPRYRVSSRPFRASILFVVLVGGVAVLWSSVARHSGHGDRAPTEVSAQARYRDGAFHPTAAQGATLTVEPVEQHAFRSRLVTEGKISINEDRATPILSPYSGRVTRLLVRAGDSVDPGQLLFVIEAADMVQAQNDFI